MSLLKVTASVLFLAWLANIAISDELEQGLSARFSVSPDLPYLAYVSEGPEDVYHVRVLLRPVFGEQSLEVLALHRRGPRGHAMEVAVRTDERGDGLLEAWVHAVSVEELESYSLHAFYSKPCPELQSSDHCREEYVLEPENHIQ